MCWMCQIGSVCDEAKLWSWHTSISFFRSHKQMFVAYIWSSKYKPTIDFDRLTKFAAFCFRSINKMHFQMTNCLTFVIIASYWHGILTMRSYINYVFIKYWFNCLCSLDAIDTVRYHVRTGWKNQRTNQICNQKPQNQQTIHHDEWLMKAKMCLAHENSHR